MTTTIEIFLAGYFKDEINKTSTASFNVTQISPIRGSRVIMNSTIYFDRNPPNLLWESVIHIPPPQGSTVASRTFLNAFQSIEDVSNNAVDTIIRPSGLSVISGRCRLDPNNSTTELIRIQPLTFDYILDNSIPNQIRFTNANMIFNCLNGTNAFIISYGGTNELNGLATAFVGSIFNGSSTDDQDVMAAHLSNILSQFSRVYP